jgi:hypothetical protein
MTRIPETEGLLIVATLLAIVVVVVCTLALVLAGVVCTLALVLAGGATP